MDSQQRHGWVGGPAWHASPAHRIHCRPFHACHFAEFSAGTAVLQRFRAWKWEVVVWNGGQWSTTGLPRGGHGAPQL